VAKRDALLELRARGLTYEEIGQIYSISRQRVHQLLTGYKPKNWRLQKRAEQRRYRQTANGKQRAREAQIRLKRKIKLMILTHYGNGKLACARCGFIDIRALSIDHINALGAKHKRENKIRSGDGMYSWLIKNNYPQGYQTLCMNCQFIKRVLNREI